MRLLLDEMYPATIAEHLRARGHEVASIHDPDFVYLEGAPDEHVFEATAATGRVLVTEHVSDFRRLESEALAQGKGSRGLVFTTNRQFPRGHPATVGRIVSALAALLAESDSASTSVFLKAPPHT